MSSGGIFSSSMIHVMICKKKIIPFAFVIFALLASPMTSRGASESLWVNNHSVQHHEYGHLMRAHEVDTTTKTVLLCIAAISILSALVSNSIIIHSVRVNRHMHTTTNYFIVNMACADILLALLNGPFTIKYTINWFAWPFSGKFGQITCIAYTISQFIIGICACFSLVIISFDRLMAVSRPLKYKSHLSWSKYLIMLTWLLSIGLSITSIDGPDLVTLSNGTTSYCLPTEPSTTIVATMLSVLLPLIFVVILCFAIAYKVWKRKVPGEGGQQAADRTSKKVTYMIISVILGFIIAWAPAIIAGFVFSQNPTVTVLGIFWPIAYSFIYLNGSFNLVIYYVFSENYRNAFRSLLNSVGSMCPRRGTITGTSGGGMPTLEVNVVALRRMNIY